VFEHVDQHANLDFDLGLFRLSASITGHRTSYVAATDRSRASLCPPARIPTPRTGSTVGRHIRATVERWSGPYDTGRGLHQLAQAATIPGFLSTLDPVPPHAMPSMAVDLRAGNRLELPWLAGKVVQLGAANGVPTPINRVVYAALKPYINGPPT